MSFVSDVNCQNTGTLWTPLHAAVFQEHTKVKESEDACNAISIIQISQLIGFVMLFWIL